MLLYDILQLQASAPEYEIDQAYRTLSRCTFQEYYLTGNTDFCAISDAYYILKQHRNEYLSTTDRDSRSFFSYVQPSLPHPVRQYLRNYGVPAGMADEHTIVHLTCTSNWERSAIPGLSVSQRARRLMERPQWEFATADTSVKENEATFPTELEGDTTRALVALRESPNQKRYLRQVLAVLDSLWKALRELDEKRDDFDLYVNIRCTYFAVFLYARTLSSDLDQRAGKANQAEATTPSLNPWCCPTLDPLSAEVHSTLLDLSLDPAQTSPKGWANVKVQLLLNRSLLTRKRMLYGRDILQQRHEQQRTPLKQRLVNGATSDPIFGVPVVLLEFLGKDVTNIRKELRERRRANASGAKRKNQEQTKPDAPEIPKIASNPSQLPERTRSTRKKDKTEVKTVSNADQSMDTNKDAVRVKVVASLKNSEPKKMSRSITSPKLAGTKPAAPWPDITSESDDSASETSLPSLARLRKRASEYGFFKHDVDYLVSS